MFVSNPRGFEMCQSVLSYSASRYGPRLLKIPFAFNSVIRAQSSAQTFSKRINQKRQFLPCSSKMERTPATRPFNLLSHGGFKGILPARFHRLLENCGMDFSFTGVASGRSHYRASSNV